MKKFIASIFALLIAVSSWAETKERAPILLGGGFALPYAYERAEYNNDTIETSMRRLGFNITLGALPQKSNWGVIDNFTFAWPQSISAKYQGKEYSTDTKDFKSLFLFETTIAFDYFFLNNEKFLLGAGPLLGMTVFTWSTEYLSSANFAFGVGANIFGLYKVTDKFGFQFGVTGVFDFYGLGSVNTATTKNSYSGSTRDWTLTPFIGLSLIL